MEPLTVTAELQAAPMIKAPLMLDALLYFATGARAGLAHPSGYVDIADVDAIPLPLARVQASPEACEAAGADLWWYAASQVTPWGPENPIYTHKRAALQEALYWTSARSVNIAAGPDKSLRKRTYERPAMSEVSWTCVGDYDEIAALLRMVPAVGAQTTHGYGWVSRWRVERGGPGLGAYRSDPTVRHIPVAELESLPQHPAITIRAIGLRPPYWRRDEVVQCAQIPFAYAAVRA